MKRVKSACIQQTLVFSQKPELFLSKELTLKTNRDEVERYKEMLKRGKIRHVILEQTEQEDGSIIVRVKKQYNETTDVSEYF